jgi:hypothetical protein
MKPSRVSTELPDRAATVFEVIKGRRSIRDFDIKEIPDEHLRINWKLGFGLRVEVICNPGSSS